MNNNPYSRILGNMKRQGAAMNGFELTPAIVTNVNPVAISYNNTRISSGIVLGGCFQTEDDLVEMINSEGNVSTELKETLKTILKAVQLSEGDKVLVQRVGDLFYILGKVS